MRWKTALLLFPAAFLLTCGESRPDAIEILAISKVPAPKTVPYPDGAAICLCQDQNGEKILVAVPAFKKREWLREFKSLKNGVKIRVTLIPWAQRPKNAAAMAIANDFADEFELRLFFIENL